MIKANNLASSSSIHAGVADHAFILLYTYAVNFVLLLMSRYILLWWVGRRLVLSELPRHTTFDPLPKSTTYQYHVPVLAWSEAWHTINGRKALWTTLCGQITQFVDTTNTYYFYHWFVYAPTTPDSSMLLLVQHKHLFHATPRTAPTLCDLPLTAMHMPVYVI
jgi:hypothetical protein